MQHIQDPTASADASADFDVWSVMAVVAHLDDEDAYADGDYLVAFPNTAEGLRQPQNRG